MSGRRGERGRKRRGGGGEKEGRVETAPRAVNGTEGIRVGLEARKTVRPLYRHHIALTSFFLFRSRELSSSILTQDLLRIGKDLVEPALRALRVDVDAAAFQLGRGGEFVKSGKVAGVDKGSPIAVQLGIVAENNYDVDWICV